MASYYLKTVDSEPDSFFAADTQLRALTCVAPTNPMLIHASQVDCDDSDNRARPNQGGYFESGRKKDGSFDFNCNGETEKDHDHDVADCDSFIGHHSGQCPDGRSQYEEWMGDEPDCGKDGTIVRFCYLDHGAHRCNTGEGTTNVKLKCR